MASRRPHLGYFDKASKSKSASLRQTIMDQAAQAVTLSACGITLPSLLSLLTASPPKSSLPLMGMKPEWST